MERDLSSSSDDYSSKCSICPQRSAKVYCLQCEQYFCVRCKRKHSGKPETSNHLLLQGFDVPGSVTRKCLHTRTLEYCHKHPKHIIQRYCTDHYLLCCEACAKEEHFRCHTEPVEERDFQRPDEKFRLVKEDLNKTIEQFKDNQCSTNDHGDLECATKDLLKKQVEEYFQRIITAINDRKTAVLEKIDRGFVGFASKGELRTDDQSLSELRKLSKTLDDPSFKQKSKAHQLEDLNIIADQIKVHKRKLDKRSSLKFHGDDDVLKTIKQALDSNEFVRPSDA